MGIRYAGAMLNRCQIGWQVQKAHFVAQMQHFVAKKLHAIVNLAAPRSRPGNQDKC